MSLEKYLEEISSLKKEVKELQNKNEKLTKKLAIRPAWITMTSNGGATIDIVIGYDNYNIYIEATNMKIQYTE